MSKSEIIALLSDPSSLAALRAALAPVAPTAPKVRRVRRGANLSQAVATLPTIASNANAPVAPKVAPKVAPVAPKVTVPSDAAFNALTHERNVVDTTCALATHKYGLSLVAALESFGGPVYSSDDRQIGFAQAWFEAEKRERAAKGISEPPNAKPFAGSYFSRARSAMKEFPKVDAANARDFLARFWGYGGRQGATAKAKVNQKPEDAVKVALSWLNTAVNRGGDPRKVLESLTKAFKEAHSL